MVGRLAASENEAFFKYGEGSTVSIQGRDGRVGQDGGLWWAAWSIPTTCDGCDQEAFVIGHGLTRDSVLAIAETVRQEPRPQADAAALPDGLRAMGSAPGSEGWIAQPPGQELVVRIGDVGGSLHIWSGDPRLYAHLAFWSPDDQGQQSSQDRWPVDLGRNVVTFTPGFRTFRAGASSASKPSEAEAATLRAAARALVPGDDQAVDEAIAQVTADLQPMETTQNLCPSDDGSWETFSGVAGDTRWGVTVMVSNGTSFTSCHSFWAATIPMDLSGMIGSDLGPVGPGGARILGGGVTGLDGRALRIVTGDVPATAVEVRVEVGGQTAEVAPGKTGPAPDRRWFATAFVLEGLNFGTRQEVTAFDASGTTVATGWNG